MSTNLHVMRPAWASLVVLLVGAGPLMGCVDDGDGDGDGTDLPGRRWIEVTVTDAVYCAVDDEHRATCFSPAQGGDAVVSPPADIALTQLSLGWNMACGLTVPEASLYCWEYLPATGDWQEQTVVALEEVPAGTGFTSVSVAISAACALGPGGFNLCWGVEDEGENDYGIVQSYPRGPLAQVELGGRRGFVGFFRTLQGTLGGWGRGWREKPEEDWLWARDPPTGSDFVDLMGGDLSACGRRADGALACWDWTEGERESDSALWGLPDGLFRDLPNRSSLLYSCGLTTDGHLQCWGEAVPGGWEDTSRVYDTVSGLGAPCGLTSDGKACCAAVELDQYPAKLVAEWFDEGACLRSPDQIDGIN